MPGPPAVSTPLPMRSMALFAGCIDAAGWKPLKQQAAPRDGLRR